MQRLANAPSRTTQVYESIRDSICDCRLEPGTHLVQEELAARLGVSRQPVQQAMLLLKNDGLVVELGGRGLAVAPLDPEPMQHHYQIRMVLDQLAARLVAEQARDSSEFAQRLRKKADVILAKGESAQLRGSAPEAVSHDVRFHSFLYEMSGNPMIATAAEPHWSFLRRVMVAVLLHAARGDLVWRQHREIVDALAEGNAELGAALAGEHVLGAEAALVGALRKGRS